MLASKENFLIVQYELGAFGTKLAHAEIYALCVVRMVCIEGDAKPVEGRMKLTPEQRRVSHVECKGKRSRSGLDGYFLF